MPCGEATANEDPSGRSNRSASTPVTCAADNPRTSRANAAICGREAVPVPANTIPWIFTALPSSVRPC
jgi:hypothetical protein